MQSAQRVQLQSIDNQVQGIVVLTENLQNMTQQLVWAISSNSVTSTQIQNVGDQLQVLLAAERTLARDVAAQRRISDDLQDLLARL